MKAWEEIINKALLGSEKAPLSPADLPPAVTDAFDVLVTDVREEAFYKISSLAYQFRQSGLRPVDLSAIARTEALPEEKRYCSDLAHTSLKAILQEDLPRFLELWLRLCAAKDQIVHPELIPDLFDVAQRKKELRELTMRVTGKRGDWLSRLNPEWTFTSADADSKSLWETGTPEQRREILTRLRMENPEAGRALLESTWGTEGANEKASFLGILKMNLSPTDLPWLQGLKEKGQKVNSAIFELLKSIPESAIVQEYQSALSQCVRIKTGKALLGMISKTELEIDRAFRFPETIFKTGIEKLSSNKGVTDQQTIIAQLAMGVPPAFWNRHLNKTAGEIIELFGKEKYSAFFVPAIAIAAVRFNDVEWIGTLLDKADDNLPASSLLSMIDALDENDRDRYAAKFLKENPGEIIQLVMTTPTEWSAEFTKGALNFLAENFQHYNKAFFRSAAALMSVSVLSKLDSFTPNDIQKQVYWSTQREELTRLLTLKQQTLQSFNA